MRHSHVGNAGLEPSDSPVLRCQMHAFWTLATAPEAATMISPSVCSLPTQAYGSSAQPRRPSPPDPGIRTAQPKGQDIASLAVCSMAQRAGEVSLRTRSRRHSTSSSPLGPSRAFRLALVSPKKRKSPGPTWHLCPNPRSPFFSSLRIDRLRHVLL